MIFGHYTPGCQHFYLGRKRWRFVAFFQSWPSIVRQKFRRVDFSKSTISPDWYRIKRWSVLESCRESPELQSELLAMSVRGRKKLPQNLKKIVYSRHSVHQQRVTPCGKVRIQPKPRPLYSFNFSRWFRIQRCFGSNRFQTKRMKKKMRKFFGIVMDFIWTGFWGFGVNDEYGEIIYAYQREESF